MTNTFPSFVFASILALCAFCPALAQEAGFDPANLYIAGTGSGANTTQTTGPGTVNASLVRYSSRTGTQTPGRNLSRTAMIGSTPVYYNLSAMNGWSGYSAALPAPAGDFGPPPKMDDTYRDLAMHNEIVREEAATAAYNGAYSMPSSSRNNSFGGQNGYFGGQPGFSGTQNAFPGGPAAITSGLNLAPRTMAGRQQPESDKSGF